MYLELDKFSFQGMSEPEEPTNPLEFQFLLRPNSEFSIDTQFPSSKSPKVVSHGQGEKSFKENAHFQPNDRQEDSAEAAAGGEESVDGEDSGYQTPTSSNHKIAGPRRCPPAPKKTKFRPLMKRKATSATRCIRVDVNQEDIEFFFRPILGSKNRGGLQGMSSKTFS